MSWQSSPLPDWESDLPDFPALALFFSPDDDMDGMLLSPSQQECKRSPNPVEPQIPPPHLVDEPRPPLQDVASPAREASSTCSSNRVEIYRNQLKTTSLEDFDVLERNCRSMDPPLSREEAKELKKMRRLVENRIAAQRSRNKKKTRIEELEGEADVLQRENKRLRIQVDEAERQNASLRDQIANLQKLIKSSPALLATWQHLYEMRKRAGFEATTGTATGATSRQATGVALLYFLQAYGHLLPQIAPDNLAKPHFQVASASVGGESTPVVLVTVPRSAVSQLSHSAFDHNVIAIAVQPE